MAQAPNSPPATSSPNDTNTAVPAPPAALPQQAAPVKQTPAPSAATSSPQSAVSTGAQTVQTGGVKIHGTITDPDGAIIPGATIAMTPQKGGARTTKSGEDGTYALTVNPGTYTLVVSMPGFASYTVTNLKVQPVPGLTLDAKLTIGETTQVVNVEASAVAVSVDPDSNASATVLSGKDLDALSDDPDELQSELTALAGPSAGPNGGQIYVDGFTGGQLPPKSSIREIRINQNPFSAQFDRLGYGRVEVFTKPGTDKFHGSAQINFNANWLNTANPLLVQSVNQPGYHTIFGMGSLSGPINKWASFNVGLFHRTIQDDAFTNTSIFATPGTTTLCKPTTQTPSAQGCVQTTIQQLTFQPSSRTEVSPRFDLALGDKNVLTTRFEYGHSSSQNSGVGNNTLPEAGSSSSGDNFEIQMSDTQTYGLHVINETRGAWERSRSTSTPVSFAPSISVAGVFSAGGSGGQYSSSHTDHFEFQNYTSIQTKKNFIRVGARYRANRSASTTTGNTNGSFTYTGLTYVNPCLQPNAPSPCTPPADNSYATGTPSQFQQTVVNNPDIHYVFWDLGLYAESDWKPLSNLTVSYGIRFETQNYLDEHHDWAPRASFAYGVGRSKQPKTVIRGGIGIFYDRFDSVGSLVTDNGLNESIYTVSNLTTSQMATCNPSNIAGCSTLYGAAGGETIYTAPPANGPIKRLQAPYILQEAIGADQQVGRVATVSVNYIHSEGVHALAVQNICALSGASCASGAAAGVNPAVNYQFITQGQFHENQLMLSPRVQSTKWLSLFGYYSLIYAYGNNSGAQTFLSQPGNFNADLGPTTFDVRQRYFIGGSITLPHHVQVSPFIIGQSGNRVNVTEGADINNDKVYNDRPYLAPAGYNILTASQVASGTTYLAKTIPGCGTFISRTSSAVNVPSGVRIAPTNYCTGPALSTVNVRFAKTWGFGGMTAAAAERQQRQGGGPGGPGGPPGGGDRRGGGGGGGRGGGGGGPMFGGGGGSTGQRYNFTLAAQVSNLFNRENLSAPVGTLTSPFFGQSKQLAGGPYSSADGLMRWSLQASFTF